MIDKQYYTSKVSMEVEIPNPHTGECELYDLKKRKDWKPSAKQGWQMIYVKNRDEIILRMKGVKRQEIMFEIENLFSKNNKIVSINQTALAKQFNTTQPYVNKVIKELIEMDYLRKVGRSEYMINPFIYVPYRADAVVLQREWKNMDKEHNENGIDDIEKYNEYLQSDKWKEISNAIKERDGKCRLCGSNENLEAHHLSYDNIYNETMDDLVALCHTCHSKQH